ncbi:FAD-binding oxidoreductase [Haloarchaeobius litoreus]|uniref:FAD-binding oxidoreductase n=1 Tax=Haloarchaeobius litoreus TaxID=755306 RepID=A0ABD6DPG6_9EURY
MVPPAEVRNLHQVTPDVKQFRLVADDHEFPFEPGQHTMVRFENDGEEETRPDTAINRPETDELVLAIKRYEDGTTSIHRRSPAAPTRRMLSGRRSPWCELARLRSQRGAHRDTVGRAVDRGPA